MTSNFSYQRLNSEGEICQRNANLPPQPASLQSCSVTPRYHFAPSPAGALYNTVGRRSPRARKPSQRFCGPCTFPSRICRRTSRFRWSCWEEQHFFSAHISHGQAFRRVVVLLTAMFTVHLLWLQLYQNQSDRGWPGAIRTSGVRMRSSLYRVHPGSCVPEPRPVVH
jgi:hypothetical protein